MFFVVDAPFHISRRLSLMTFTPEPPSPSSSPPSSPTSASSSTTTTTTKAILVTIMTAAVPITSPHHHLPLPIIPIPLPLAVHVLVRARLLRHSTHSIIITSSSATIHVLLLLLLLQLLSCHLALGPGLLHILIRRPPRMRALLAQFPIRTEARQIIQAQLPPEMLLVAPGAQRTEAPLVVRTGRQPRQGVNVQIQALVPVAAVPVSHKEVALGHLAQVVLV